MKSYFGRKELFEIANVGSVLSGKVVPQSFLLPGFVFAEKQQPKKCACGFAWEHTGKHARMGSKNRKCNHICSGKCRREGCNCECGYFHVER